MSNGSTKLTVQYHEESPKYDSEAKSRFVKFILHTKVFHVETFTLNSDVSN